MIIVVGIGADGMAGLGERSRRELSSATVIYGSQRQLDLLDNTVTAARRAWPSPMLDVLKQLSAASEDIHVVASGDPLLHGVGGTLIRLHGAANVRILPHVSSVTLACAQMGWPVHDTEVISLVTAPVHTAVRRGGQAVVLSRDSETPGMLARTLVESGRGASEFAVLEQLGGVGQRVHVTTAEKWATDQSPDIDALNVMAIRYLPDERIAQTLPDDHFQHDGNITKQSIRAVTLAALAPRPGELLWDVGAGSGSISVEWCRSAAGCRSVAFEIDALRTERIMVNAKAFGAQVDVRGTAPESFDGVPAPVAVFVGGGVTVPGLLEGCLEKLVAGGRLVANAVTAESEAALVEWHSRRGGELRRFQHYRGEPLGRYTGWKPQLPITQWLVTKEW